MTSWMAAARAAVSTSSCGHFAPNPVGDVFADGAREQEGLLLDNADLLAQVAARVVCLAPSHPAEPGPGCIRRNAAAG